MRQGSSVVDELDARSRNSFGKLLRIYRRNNTIRLTPEDERRGANAVYAVLESAIGDRPNKLAGASERPVELCQRVDARFRIAWNLEESSGGFAIRIGKQCGSTHFVAKNHPIFYWMVVAP